jgi:hypothetical protein
LNDLQLLDRPGPDSDLVVAVGSFQGANHDFPDTPGRSAIVGAGNSDAFVEFWDATTLELSATRHVRVLGGSGQNYGKALAVSGQTILVGGYYYGDADFGDSFGLVGPEYQFVANYSNTGFAMLIDAIGDGDHAELGWLRFFDNSDVNGVGLDGNGHALVGINFYSSLDLDQATNPGAHMVTAQDRDIALARYQTSDGAYDTLFQVGGPGDDYLRWMGCDGGGKTWLAGRATQGITLPAGNIAVATFAPTSVGFVIGFDDALAHEITYDWPSISTLAYGSTEPLAFTVGSAAIYTYVQLSTSTEILVHLDGQDGGVPYRRTTTGAFIGRLVAP